MYCTRFKQIFVRIFVDTRYEIFDIGSFITQARFILEKTQSPNNLYLGIPKAIQRAKKFFIFLLLGGKIQFKNSIQD